MGRYIEQTEGRSELQQKIAADLRAKASAKAKDEGTADGSYYKERDGVNDAAYLKGTKVTTTLAPAWILSVIFSFAVVIYFVAQTSK